MPLIPLPPRETSPFWAQVHDKLENPESQKRIILVIVCIALLLDNMLYMVIVPIIPDYLRDIGMWTTHTEDARLEFQNVSNRLVPMRIGGRVVYEGEDSAIGMLFASKAIVQLFINPFSGAIIDRIGYDLPMMIGLTIMFFSTAVFACGKSYSVLFFARSLQGVGSAFADTAGLAMIASRFSEENERQRALGIALAFISFGSLVAPPFGGLLYEFFGKELPFIILSLVCLIDGIMVLLVMEPVKKQQRESGVERLQGTSIATLLKDPYIACCAGGLVMANVSLAFLEPTISIWMQDNMDVEEWQIGMIWLPGFIPHVAGVYATVKLAEKYPRYQWAMAAVGIAIEGLCCIWVPFSTNFWGLFLPISGICFGIAMVDTAILPLLGFLVDTRYVSVYGSIYAIADISYSLAYAFGPIIAGGVVETIGFTALNIIIALSNLAYVPVLFYLRKSYDMADYGKMQGVEQMVSTADPPGRDYRTCAVQQGQPDGGPVDPTTNAWGDEGPQGQSGPNPFLAGSATYAPQQQSGVNQYEMRSAHSANYSSNPSANYGHNQPYTSSSQPSYQR
ncbi:Vesicular acetylcholine transporter [Halotydeus destructor]|nr:Vesicular acetylcholine transporter [Halotydeus destructor]